MAKTIAEILATPLVVPALVVLALAAIAVVALYFASAPKKPKRRSRAHAGASTAAGTVKVNEDGHYVRRSTR